MERRSGWWRERIIVMEEKRWVSFIWRGGVLVENVDVGVGYGECWMNIWGIGTTVILGDDFIGKVSLEKEFGIRILLFWMKWFYWWKRNHIFSDDFRGILRRMGRNWLFWITTNNDAWWSVDCWMIWYKFWDFIIWNISMYQNIWEKI